MSLSPYFVFSKKFREEIGRTGGFEPPADFFNKHEDEVKEYSASVCGDRVPLMPGASHDRIQKFWSSRADRILLKRALQTPTAVRPPSPTFKPTDSNEKKIAPKLPLTPNPGHRSNLLFKPHAVADQITIYKDAAEMERRGTHIRVGKPVYMATHDSALALVGKKNLFDVYGIFAQYSLYREAFQANFPAATLAEIELGLRTAREAADFRSPLFRGDLLAHSSGPMSKQDSLIGFSGAETTMKQTEQSVRYNKQTGRKEYYNRPFRLPEFILTASRFDLIFPSFEQRETVRRLIGATSSTFPSNMSLLSPEEYADLTRLWSVLPKMRRRAFTIVLYHEGLAVGSVLFAGQTRTLSLKPGETALSIDDFYCQPTNNYLNRGPLASNTILRYDSDEKRAQLQSQKKIQEEKTAVLSKLEKHAQVANYFDEALSSGGQIDEKAHRESMRQVFNHQLADVMASLSQEDQRLSQLIRERVPSLQGVPDFSKIEVDRSKPCEPGFIHIDAEGMKIRLPLHELQQYFTIDFKDKLISSLRTREEDLRSKLESLGFVSSFSPEYQHFMLRVKSTRNFMSCSKCFNVPQPKTCLCMMEYWTAILENGPIEWDDFGPCGYCCYAKCYEKTCDCQHDHILALSAELKRLKKLGLGMPCPKCFGPEESCQCYRYEEGAGHHGGNEQNGDLYGETVRNIGNVTPGNISETANPDFSTPDIITAEDTAFLCRAEPTGILTFAELEQLAEEENEKTVDPVAAEDLDQTFVPGDHFQSPDQKRSARMLERSDGSKHCSSRGWGVPSSEQSSGASAGVADTNDEVETAPTTLMATESPDFQNAVSVEDILNFSASALQYLEKSKRPILDDLLSHTQEPATTSGQVSEKRSEEPSFREQTQKVGVAVIPADVLLVNGHSEGAKAYPEYIREDGEKTAVLPALFQTPYTAGVSSDWLNSCANIEAIKQRYTKKREDGHSYCPLDTLTQILRDVSRSRLPKPAQEKTKKELEKLFGRDAAAKVIEAREKNEQLLVARATSYHMEEPSDIPNCAHRPWTYRLCDLEAHQGTPLSIYIQYLGQISYTSQSWEEYLDSDRRQYLRSTFPGKPSGTFILSSGGRRESDERQSWPVKLAGRVLTCLLVGGGLQLTPEEFAAQGFTDDMCLNPDDFCEEPPFTEPENSVGSRPGSMTIPADYEPKTRIGKWEKIQEDGEVVYQKLFWEGFGYRFHMSGYDAEDSNAGHRIIFTRDGDVPSEIIQAEYGLGFWASEQRNGIQSRYEARCRSRGTRWRSEAFTCPFAHGALSVFWADLVPLVSRVLGPKWRESFEDLVFSICDDQNIVYRHGTREETASNGRYNESREFPNAKDSEMLARVDMDGRIIYLPEERAELKEAQLYDYGYKFSALTTGSRSRSSNKFYTSCETAAKETL